ncbi:hypothetical protein AKJ29_13460 [Aliiroseovarius crassostreae]|uniref:Uncharacterized protein n=1 Tax=Aliiroseovarius crassostreae TaxID=154981 RepID=A0A0P7KNA6_9RHOB|nr:hypothetical protein AKJ29_13460 [Aliiroseovarius crassostreae]
MKRHRQCHQFLRKLIVRCTNVFRRGVDFVLHCDNRLAGFSRSIAATIWNRLFQFFGESRKYQEPVKKPFNRIQNDG